MIKRLVKSIKFKIKDFFYFLHINRKKGVLIYLGLNNGISFGSIFRSYKICYGFEADPELCKKLIKRFKKYKNVHIINAAVTNFDGEITFNITDNDGLSSSIGILKEDWGKNSNINMIKTIKVKAINLYKFLVEKDIHKIDDYFSDIQGYDLEVLKTLKPFIKEKKIGTITSEVTKDNFKNIYKDSPDNSESGFAELLESNYKIIATGEGVLEDGKFKKVPDNWWEYDCKWKIKDNV